MINFYLYNKLENNDEFKIMSIDPGVKNFAVRIEIISNITFKTIKLLYYNLIDVRHDKNKKVKEQNVFKIIMNIKYYLKEMENIIEGCNFILIEEQIGVNSIPNNIFYFMIGYFINKYKECNILGISPKLKSKYLKFPKGLKGKRLKDHTRDFIMKSFEDEGDIESIEIINRFDKKDDLADTKAMIKSIIIMINN